MRLRCPGELLYADNLALISESLDNLKGILETVFERAEPQC